MAVTVTNSDKRFTPEKRGGTTWTRGMQAYSPNYVKPGTVKTIRPAAGSKKSGYAPGMSTKFSQPKPQEAGQTNEEMIAELLGTLGGGGGGGGGRGGISAGQRQAMAANRARLEALYQRLAEDIAGRESAIEQMYQTAGTNLGGIYDTSVGEINKAYDAARAAQTAQLLALGMTEQAPPQSFGSQTAATTSLQNLRAAVLAQNEASRKAAITNQRLSSEAARREGAERLAQYDAEVAQAIAAASSGGGGGGGGGGGLTPYQQATLLLKGREMDMDAQRAAAEFALKSQPAAKPNLQTVLNQVANTSFTPEQLKAADLLLKYG